MHDTSTNAEEELRPRELGATTNTSFLERRLATSSQPHRTKANDICDFL